MELLRSGPAEYLDKTSKPTSHTGRNRLINNTAASESDPKRSGEPENEAGSRMLKDCSACPGSLCLRCRRSVSLALASEAHPGEGNANGEKNESSGFGNSDGGTGWTEAIVEDGRVTVAAVYRNRWVGVAQSIRLNDQIHGSLPGWESRKVEPYETTIRRSEDAHRHGGRIAGVAKSPVIDTAHIQITDRLYIVSDIRLVAGKTCRGETRNVLSGGSILNLKE
jgi:hypothetical protein